jgi:hypothetical protein
MPLHRVDDVLYASLKSLLSFAHDFCADDYRKHTSCVTEVERYEKRAPRKNSKVSPQQMWMDLITSSVETAPTHLKSHMRTMSILNNVPRKEKAFYNFTANSLNLRGKSGEATVSEIWIYLNGLRGKQASVKPQSWQIDDDVHIIDSADTTNNATVCEISPKAQRGGVMETHATTGKSDGLSSESQTTFDSNSNGALSQLKTSNSRRVSNSVIDRKVVKKKMIQALKKAKACSLTLKLLRKTVMEACPGSERNLIKTLVRQNLDRGKHFLMESKTVTLKIK